MNLRCRRERAVALVITLALVVLLTFLVVAFFSRATANRQIESASAARTSANILARSAADLIAGDLRTEIVAGSDRFGSPSEPPMYKPLSAINSAPFRAVGPAAGGPAFTNLIKQSSGRFFPARAEYPNEAPVIQADTGIATDVPSPNNRLVSPGRWDMPMLTLPTSTPNPPTGSNFTSASIPRWIVMSRAGVTPSQSWASTMKDYAPGNQNAVIGRFAFNVYDIGGLLDVNVIGLPSTITSAGDIQRYKGTLTGAELRGVAAPIDPAALTKWKYKASFSSGNGNAVQMDAAWDRLRNFGFLKPWQNLSGGETDLMALSRQDLLRLAQLPSGHFAHAGMTPDVLPYITHFSREINAPSWWQYFHRVTKSFTSWDGTQLEVGQQIVRRFPLQKLSWLGPNGIVSPSPVKPDGTTTSTPVAISAPAVQQAFGLVWSADHWIYAGPSGTTPVATIAFIPTDRDANFFELIAEAKRKTTGGADIAEILSIGASMIDHNDGSSAVPDTQKQITSIEYLGPLPSPVPSPSPANPRAWGLESPGPSPYPKDAPTPPPNAVVLNHTIRGVGEMGYAYKADKLQTVDFANTGSLDREILDLFTVSPTRVRAGVLSLNTRNAEALGAVLRKSLEGESGNQVTDGEANDAAAFIVNETTGTAPNPAQSRAAIAKLTENSRISGLPEKKELIARALGEVTQTRTWNVLIDVIAQSGQFPQRATSHGDFVVSGEQRYWLSIAIDRDSGEIIDQQLEAVVE